MLNWQRSSNLSLDLGLLMFPIVDQSGTPHLAIPGLDNHGYYCKCSPENPNN